MTAIDVLHPMSDDSTVTRTSKSTLKDQIASIIKSRIQAGDYRPGDKLPSVRQLSDTFNVSRETAKLSLNLLSREGWIEVIPSRGGYVLENRSHITPAKRTGTVGFLIDLGDGPQDQNTVDSLYGSLFHMMDLNVAETGSHILTTHIVYGAADGPDRLERFAEKVDGLFVTGLINPDLLNALKDLEIPVVSLLSNLDVEDIDEIGIGSHKTYRRVTRQMMDWGHRCIAYIDGPKVFYQQTERIHGCMAAIDDDPDIRYESFHAAGWTQDDAYEITRSILKTLPEVDCILAVNDIFGSGALKAAREYRRDVPRDISIVGAKNTILSENSDPAMTSVDYHFDRISGMAVNRMNSCLQEADNLPIHTELIGTLLQRNSTRNRQFDGRNAG